MFKAKLGLVHVTLLMLLYSSSCLAVSTQFNQIFQTDPDTQQIALQNKIFDRDTYNAVGAKINLAGTSDQDGYYIVPVGSTWKWELHFIEDDIGAPVNQLVGEHSITYLGETDNCSTMWSNGRCTTATNWSVWWTFPCAGDGRYRIKVLFNGTAVGEDTFSPTRYKPVLYSLGTNETIKPKKSNSDLNAEKTAVIVRVAGLAGNQDQCLIPLENAIVKLTNTITANTGSHKHFTDTSEIGTGIYEPWSASDILNPDIAETNDTVIEGATDRDGYFLTHYKAGDFGLTETVTIEARRDETAIHPELTATPYDYTLDIKVPSLVPLSTNNIDYTLRGSFKLSKKCDDRTHNKSATDRKSHYLTNNARAAVTAMARLYKVNTLGVLSLNDASLAFGGVFDKGSLNRDETCHVSHRNGIDVDINSIDSKGRDIWFDLYDDGVNGAFAVLFYDLEKFALIAGGFRIPEGESIHYRFNKVNLGL